MTYIVTCRCAMVRGLQFIAEISAPSGKVFEILVFIVQAVQIWGFMLRTESVRTGNVQF